MPSGGRASREKGLRRERQLVDMHRELGLKAERVPLSGATRYQNNGADIDVYPFGVDQGALIGEAKARASGEGFTTIKKWLGKNDLLWLIEDRADPLVVLPWTTYERILLELKKARGGAK